MINEMIKQIYYKGIDDRFPDDYPNFQTDRHFYRLDLGGFDVLENIDISEYHKYMEGNLASLKIAAVFANGHDMYVRFSNNRILSLGAGEGGLELRLEDYEAYNELRERFESPGPREGDLQQLAKEHPRWLNRG